jgi:hypothetical protein
MAGPGVTGTGAVHGGRYGGTHTGGSVGGGVSIGVEELGCADRAAKDGIKSDMTISAVAAMQRIAYPFTIAQVYHT